MRMGWASLFVLIAACLTLSAEAVPIDVDTTSAGGKKMTGGRDQQESYGLSQLLQEINNELTPDEQFPYSKDLIDAMIGLEASNFHFAVGFIIEGPDGVKFTYDRMAHRPVLQILGYNKHTGFEVRSIHPHTNPPHKPEHPGGTGSLYASQNDTPQPDPPTTDVPEPASMLILAGGCALLARRPRRRFAPTAGS